MEWLLTYSHCSYLVVDVAIDSLIEPKYIEIDNFHM